MLHSLALHLRFTLPPPSCYFPIGSPGVAELADAADSKSAGDHSPCGFDSLLRDQFFCSDFSHIARGLVDRASRILGRLSKRYYARCDTEFFDCFVRMRRHEVCVAQRHREAWTKARLLTDCELSKMLFLVVFAIGSGEVAVVAVAAFA
jgi:hypothetical protein